MSGKNVAKMQRGIVDRISELPEFILHTILSMLDTKEACRSSVLSKRWFAAWSSIPVLDFRPQYFRKFGATYDDDTVERLVGFIDTKEACRSSVLSKRWFAAWSSIPVLDFRPQYFRKFGATYDDDTVERLVGFIDKIMERYFTRKYRITKMYLMLPKVNDKIKHLVDKWIMIAVQNQIQELEIRLVYGCKYRLPEILFSAKSLKVLICKNVGVPYYDTMELVSLEYLTLYYDILDEDMFQRIISSCPLIELDITYENCLKQISLPWMKKVNGGVESRGSGTMQFNRQEYPLQKFVCRGLSEELPWPWNMNVVALKNLRKLEFVLVPITDDVVSEVSHGLVVLESLVISHCFMLKCINISSNSLIQLQIARNLGLMEVKIDAPKLLEFLCTCELETSLSLVQALDRCNAQFCPLVPGSVSPVWFINLNKFLTKANFFKSLVIQWSRFPEMEVEHDQLMNASIGVPFKLRELKLRGPSIRTPTKSSLVAFLNGLFWCCHPDVLSMTTNLQNSAAKLILIILQEKAECLKDPLKSIEVESMEYPRLLPLSSTDETWHRLSW